MIAVSPAHADAVQAAIRLPAITARHALLESGSGSVEVEVYAEPRVAAGAAPEAPPLAIIAHEDPTTLDEAGLRITLGLVEGQIVAPGQAAWARIRNRAGAWWADCDVSDPDGSGEIKLNTLDLVPGAFLRLTSGIIQG